jgi:hypothetical protein
MVQPLAANDANELHHWRPAGGGNYVHIFVTESLQSVRPNTLGFLSNEGIVIPCFGISFPTEGLPSFNLLLRNSRAVAAQDVLLNLAGRRLREFIHEDE